MMAKTTLPSPDFNCTAPECIYKAGVRPYRKGSFRLSAETIGPKFVVHNYGHGGAGITMSWGCADAVVKIVGKHAAPGTRVAVVGAGVMGLTAATLLTKDYTVSIYADRLSGTTSDVAGGQWAPSVVEFDQSNAAAKQQFEDILRVAYRMHEQRIGQNFGVSYRTNYTKKLSATFDKVPKDIISAPDDYPQLPFAKLKSKGYGYKTLLVEPPVFLTRLRADLRTAGVVPQHKVFGSAADVTNLAEPTIINCTGHGAGVLFHDKDIVPIKGQLVLLKAQPGLDYLYSTDQTYVFPRSDHVVVGGSYECGVNDENPVPSMCEHIRKMAEDVFAGLAFTTADDRPWLMRNK